ncbi:hypothetical protein ES708_02675 [subsurface metagenome]
MIRVDQKSAQLDTKREPRYSLKGCQVATPSHVVEGVWRLIGEYRSDIGRVVDFGAGDGRFAYGGRYKSYLGIEIDDDYERQPGLPRNARICKNCAFDFNGGSYDLCIGNPPYIRHHKLDKVWLQGIRSKLQESLGVSISLQANLFIYFMCLAIQKTKPDGLVALVVPFEWTTRPSARGLRELLRINRWNVDVYRLANETFEGVLTTASIVFIDKASTRGRWRYYDVNFEWDISERKGPTGSGEDPIHYEGRGPIWAMRGVSPGTQAVFTLTDGQRVHNGLAADDVIPCITTLRPVPRQYCILDKKVFDKYYVRAGEKCWLIRSYDHPSPQLQAYLDSIVPELRNTATCKKRQTWYKYHTHPVPRILYASGFVSIGPKILVNRIKATPVGSVQGIYSTNRISDSSLAEYLRNIDFEKQVVAHAGSLKKIEVKQMNAILSRYCTRGNQDEH